MKASFGYEQYSETDEVSEYDPESDKESTNENEGMEEENIVKQATQEFPYKWDQCDFTSKKIENPLNKNT